MSGSKGFQCDAFGQCPCNDNVEGRRCDRCKENKYNRTQGCLDCPDCYNLVRDAANEHRAKLARLNEILQQVASSPYVIDDEEFESKLKTVQEKIDILVEDAKSGSGDSDRTLLERINDLHGRFETIQKLLSDSDQLKETTAQNIELARNNVESSENIKNEAEQILTVSVTLLTELLPWEFCT